MIIINSNNQIRRLTAMMSLRFCVRALISHLFSTEALLVYLTVKITYALDLECPNTVSCPCGSEEVNVT